MQKVDEIMFKSKDIISNFNDSVILHLLHAILHDKGLSLNDLHGICLKFIIDFNMQTALEDCTP